jgi:hypothetical protein
MDLQRCASAAAEGEKAWRTVVRVAPVKWRVQSTACKAAAWKVHLYHVSHGRVAGMVPEVHPAHPQPAGRTCQQLVVCRLSCKRGCVIQLHAAVSACNTSGATSRAQSRATGLHTADQAAHAARWRQLGDIPLRSESAAPWPRISKVTRGGHPAHLRWWLSHSSMSACASRATTQIAT